MRPPISMTEALSYVDGLLTTMIEEHRTLTPTDLTAYLVGVFRSMALDPARHYKANPADSPVMLAAAEQRHREAENRAYIGVDLRRN